jgi:hypothetical protein
MPAVLRRERGDEDEEQQRAENKGLAQRMAEPPYPAVPQEQWNDRGAHGGLNYGFKSGFSRGSPSDGR